jgi:tetratricopeptide (TPR) repeat protein/tRNA A-37 threonylcarbamoyl transferase component Bud32
MSSDCPTCGARIAGAAAVDAPTASTVVTPSTADQTTIGPTPLAEAAASITGRTAVVRDAGPLEPGQAFGSRYHIIRLLGVGGMGAVYQAWDAELGVAVAIKVIRPEIMADPHGAEEMERRFKRELRLARQVTHKNVVRIHDLGEIDGIKYITMPFVDGAELTALLNEQGKLALSAVVRIARSVVSGLVAAHTAGVVHRDLKPANIMIDRDGDALIMDFGIARSTGGTSPAAAVGGASLPASLLPIGLNAEVTMQGLVVGTIEYMAPEQARGESVDQRADIYAMGLILYDGLLGKRRARQAESAVAELRSRMEHPPPSIKTLAPEVPDAFADLISRCVEPDPAKRFQTTTELAAALARLDDKGELIPVRRVLGVPAVAVVVVLLLSLSAGTWWYQRQFIPPAVHDPVSVVIADFQNNTADSAFDRTLEPMVKRALEGAGFITAYDRNGIRGLGVAAREQLPEAAAHELAVQKGLGVVLSGSIGRQGNGYRIALKAIETVAGKEITSQQGRASDKNQVLEVATRLVTRVRSALGDETSASRQQFAMASLSATSMEVVRLYAKALEAQSGNRFEEAQRNAAQAVALDPKFGIGYLILATNSRTLGRLDDNQKYLNEALSHLDGMTERERYQTRGYSYLTNGDYGQCVKEFSDLIARYPGDVAGHNQLALCLSNLRKMRQATDEMRAIVKILPRHPLFRVNLALYSNYASDFQGAEQEARQVEGPDAYATLALAFAQLGQGQLVQAKEAYQRLGQLGPLGASFAASGLGDLAAVEGRFSDAVELLRHGSADDLAAKNADSAAAKLAAIAYAELSRGRPRQAVDAAEEAVGRSKIVKIRFLAARVFVEAGQEARARPLIDSLARELYAEPRAYAQLLEGNLALKKDNARPAMTMLRTANELFETWIGLFDLGRASLAAGAFTQADSAFDVCVNARRGEALSLFADEEPTYAYLPQAYYYQGKVREGLKSAGAAESYRQYLAFRGNSSEDPLAPQARKQVGR